MTGQSEEVFSHQVTVKRRTYYFDVKQMSDGSRYLSVREVTRGRDRTVQQARVVIAEEDLAAFRDGLGRALDFLGLQELPKTTKLEKVRRVYPQAGRKWTEEQEARLIEGFKRGESVQRLARLLQRQPSAIRSRLEKLGLVEASFRTRPERSGKSTSSSTSFTT